MDKAESETQAVYADDLGIAEPIKTPRVEETVARPAPPVPMKPKDPKEGKVVIRVYRGNKATEEIF
jgi:hypothetical protein